ncbi:MAG TPA: glycosyltransferase [Glycomyces sp.]|nr:glycosyltransferase [Glycomyces sp.]
MSLPFRFTAPAAVVAATAASTTAPLVLPGWEGPAFAGLVALAFLGAALRDGAALRRLRRDITAKATAEDLLADLARTAPPTQAEIGDARRIERVREALEGGFPDSAVEEAAVVAERTRIPAAVRLDLLQAVVEWHAEDERRPRVSKRSSFDVVFISHFGLSGGNTSANVADIRVCRDQGLTIGLLHHPVYQWGPDAPIDPRVAELVDGASVRVIGLDEEVACDVAVVRLPTALMRPLERRPAISAGHTVVIANQTPFKFYGPDGPREPVWDVATVDENIGAWLGRPTWYAGGPLVHAVLTGHHAEEVARVDLAPAPWNESIDIDDWRLAGRRAPDGRIRIGRHSRDHRLKWPEDPETLLQCYPDRDPFDIRVLGGAEVPTRVLAGLPANWTVAPFGSLTPREFLAEIDLMVYFIAADGLEAFGRAPLEAMAAGVPVIMDRRFEATFGPAAVYCEPHEVAAVAERLIGDPDEYAARRAAAWDHVAAHCSGRALLERLSAHAPNGSLGGRGASPRAGADHRLGSGGSEGIPKARFIGDLVKEQEITSVIDWGCGDEEALEKLDLHGVEYTGVVASEDALERMRKRFAERPGHTFTLPHGCERWERRELALGSEALPLCPDDAEYEQSLKRLFESSRRFVLVCVAQDGADRRLRPRSIAGDVSERFPEWELRRAEPSAPGGPRSLFLYEKTG